GAGFHRVRLPAGVPAVPDYRTGRTVDPVRFGRSLGLDVTRVASVHDAYVAMTGQATAPPAAGRPPAIAPGLLRMLGRRSRTLIAAAGRYPSADVLGLAHAAERALAGHRQVLPVTRAA